MKKTAILCLLLALVLLVGCGKKEAAQPTEATKDTVNGIPGLEDSIFDNDSVDLEVSTTPSTEPTATEETKDTTTKDTTPEESSPTQKPEIPTAPQNPGDVQEPDAPTVPDKPSQDPVVDQGPAQCTYEEFAAMTPLQQQSVMESYESIEAFFAWYDEAKKAYEEAHPPIEVGNGNINLNDYLK